MADFAYTLQAAPILGGADLTIGENRIVERDDLALVSIATPLGGDKALDQTLKDGWGLSIPEPTVSLAVGETRLIRTAPDQMIMSFPYAGPDAAHLVQAKLGDTGYTTDQTDVWVVLDVKGPETLAALERICPLDLSDQHFPENASARTVMEHMGAMIMRLGPERFLLMSASSSARSFLHAVETSYRHVS